MFYDHVSMILQIIIVFALAVLFEQQVKQCIHRFYYLFPLYGCVMLIIGYLNWMNRLANLPGCIGLTLLTLIIFLFIARMRRLGWGIGYLAAWIIILHV